MLEESREAKVQLSLRWRDLPSFEVALLQSPFFHWQGARLRKQLDQKTFDGMVIGDMSDDEREFREGVERAARGDLDFR